MEALQNKYLTITTQVDGAPQEFMFDLKSETIPSSVESESNDVIVRCIYVSVDPYQINRMKSESSSQSSVDTASKITPGMKINANGVGKVVASGHSDYQQNDIVCGLLNWEEYTIVKNGNMLRKLDPMGFPLSYHINVLGTSGLTAYLGFFKVCKPKKGEKALVSTACGSVGNLVGQYAKLFGCYVVGCAGTKEKVNLLIEKLGFDDAFNYKEEPNLKSTLQRYFPNGIDMYFDNVGGEMLEAAVANMNSFGRVALCGVISEYTNAQKRAAPNMVDIIYKRITIQGFLCTDYSTDVFEDFMSRTTGYLRDGKLYVLEDISRGIDNLLSAFIGLFRGDNVGKKIVQLADY